MLKLVTAVRCSVRGCDPPSNNPPKGKWVIDIDRRIVVCDEHRDAE